MPVVMVGARKIRYEVRHSERAQKKRVEVTPSRVRVIVPAGTSEDETKRFVAAKRRWIHNQTEVLAEESARFRDETPIGYHSGAKVLFRGRYLMLRVRKTDVEKPTLSYQTRFHVEVPAGCGADERRVAVRQLLQGWFEERLIEDAWAFIRRRGRPEGLVPTGVKVKEQKTLWGSCGKDRVLRLDRKLVRLPKPVLEYVVVHEICHLRYRDHSEEFWALVRRLLPDYLERKAWLEAHEVRVT